MVRIVIVWVALCLLPVQLQAQGGAICIYADPAGTDCPLEDKARGLVEFYVLHTLAPGVTGSQFSAPKPSCMVGATAYINSSWSCQCEELPPPPVLEVLGSSVVFGKTATTREPESGLSFVSASELATPGCDATRTAEAFVQVLIA